MQSKQLWSRRLRLILWLVVAAGLVAALPIGYERLQTERSAKQVEFVFNYRSVMEIAMLQTNPQDFIEEQLVRLKEAGVHSFAVYESTLSELRSSRRIRILSSSDAALLSGGAYQPNENFTYILFTSNEAKDKLQPIIEAAFARDDIPVRLWNPGGQAGLVIEAPPENATVRTMAHDPMTLELLERHGLQIIIRLSDRIRPYDEAEMDQKLAEFHRLGVQRIIFDGEAVTGFADDAESGSLASFASLLDKHQIGIAAIEVMRLPQKGLSKLAYLADYNVARLYSLPDRDATLSKTTLADRFVLAVKDRNIRMIYLNAATSRDRSTNLVVHPIENIAGSLEGPDGAIERIQAAGYTLGPAQPFEYIHSGWQRYVKMIVLAGGAAMIALLISFFLPVTATAAAFAIGLVGTAGLALRSPALLEQAMALGVGIVSPTLAIVLAIRHIRARSARTEAELSADLDVSAEPEDRRSRQRRERGTERGVTLLRLANAFGLYGRTALISVISIPYIVALLNNVTYMLVLQQYRGVSLLHVAPIVLVAVYVIFYSADVPIFQTIARFMKMNIKVWWVAAAAIVGIAGMYYLSRTGNAGQVLPLERWFRAMLEDTFGVRPRNKEFMFAHPLLLFGLYLALKYRKAVFLFTIGVIGQLSMIDTFAHIHTPLSISAIRIVLGLVLGAAIGLIYIIGWEWIERGWKRWMPRLRG